jgi:hypothetical protein
VIRPIFRATAAVLGVLFILMGALILIKNISSSGALRGEWQGSLFLLGWGVIFVAIGIRGSMTRR